PLQLRLGAVQLGGIGSRVDHEQDVAPADLAALGEGDLLDVTGDPWPDVHRFHRLQPSSEVVPLRDLALQHRRYCDGGRRGRGRGLAAASGSQRQSGEPAGEAGKRVGAVSSVHTRSSVDGTSGSLDNSWITIEQEVQCNSLMTI